MTVSFQRARVARPVVVAAAGLMVAGLAGLGGPNTDAGASRSAVTHATASTPCGSAPVAKPGGGSWTCTFNDEFNGTSLNTNDWVVEQTSVNGYTSGGECYTKSPDIVSVSGGTLNLTVEEEPAPFTCDDPYGDYTTQYTSGMVTTAGKFSQAYGLFEIRAKLPATTVPGLQESFWLWPQDSTLFGSVWPDSGEIDIAEIYSEYPTLAVPFIHYVEATPDPDVTSDNCVIPDIAQFNTYGLEWTPTSLTIIYNGQTCLTDSWDPASPLVAPEPFNQPFTINLTQALGVGTNAFDPGATPLPATTQVDWVRVWS